MSIKVSLIDRGFGILMKFRGEVVFSDYFKAQDMLLHGSPHLQKALYLILDYGEMTDLHYTVSEVRNAASGNIDFPSNLLMVIHAQKDSLATVQNAWNSYGANTEKSPVFFDSFEKLEEWLSANLNGSYNGFIIQSSEKSESEEDKGILKHKVSGYFHKILEMQMELNQETRTDYLTGFYTRKNFNDLFQNEKSRMIRKETPLSFLYCDINSFKKINDIHGHEAGNVVLKHVATILRNNIRRYDSIWRWSGEEFLIMLPEASLKNAARIAHKLRLIMDQTIIFHENVDIQISMSFGVAELAAEEDQDQFLNRLYALLQRAKEKEGSPVAVEPAIE